MNTDQHSRNQQSRECKTGAGETPALHRRPFMERWRPAGPWSGLHFAAKKNSEWYDCYTDKHRRGQMWGQASTPAGLAALTPRRLTGVLLVGGVVLWPPAQSEPRAERRQAAALKQD